MIVGLKFLHISRKMYNSGCMFHRFTDKNKNSIKSYEFSVRKC